MKKALHEQKQRLDVLLHARGFFDSREKARRAVMAGQVLVNDHRIDKPGTPVASDATLLVRETCRYVSRGGLKLEAALTCFKVDPTGRICLDVGASTGGFTDCLLQHGAASVYAYDVGHSQLDWKIRSDSRVIVREKINARHLTAADLSGAPPSLVVIDVSFISLTLILQRVSQVLAPGGEIIALIKPQFELRREQISKGGIVSDPELHEQAVAKIHAFIAAQSHLVWQGVIPSPITGTSGNKEFLIHLTT